jgi:hypothetical protein
MSALPPEADMLIVGINVCYVPKADIRVWRNVPREVRQFEKEQATQLKLRPSFEKLVACRQWKVDAPFRKLVPHPLELLVLGDFDWAGVRRAL